MVSLVKSNDTLVNNYETSKNTKFELSFETYQVLE